VASDAVREPASVDESWQAYRYLADNAIDVVLEADLTTRIRWVSPSVEEVLGWHPDELVGRSAPELVHPDDMPEIGALAQALNEQAARVRAGRVRMQCKDGAWKALQLRGRPALDAAGAVVGHIITFQDTTERDDALRALSVLSEGNRVLARVDSEDDLLQQMCEAIVTAGNYPLAWYGQRVDDEQRSVTKRAMAGPSASYVDAIEISWGDDPLGAGPTGTALRTGTTQVRGDYPEDDRFRPWLAAAQQAGLRSSISLPVTVDDEVDGVLVVAAAEGDAFDERAVALLETLASDLGLGLHRLRSLRALEQSTLQLEEQNARLQGVFDSQFDPFVLLEAVRDDSGTAVDLRYIAMSDATLEYNRLTREEMLGHTISELFPGQVNDGSLAAYLSVMETGAPIVLDDFEYFHEPRQETVRLDIRAVKSGDGVAITFRDVTQRHEAAAALAASEERYRILAEHATDVVWQAEPDVGIVWSSESVTPVLGWEPREVVGRAEDLVHPDDIEGALLNLRGLARGLTVQGEARVACKDGTWKWVSYTASRATIGERVVDIASLHDIDEEVRARNALDFALGHDPLTGMPARPAMLQRIGEALGSLRGQRLAAVLCLGVDRLSAVNEAYTHAAGDLVLTAMATRIAEVVGRPDAIGRGTGVEFLVVLPGLASGDEAAVLAQRLLDAAKAPVVVGDVAIEPTVSIGIAVGDRTSDREQLARDSSAAMGQAKADGRDRFVFADASMADQARHRLDVERRLREALEDDRFLSYCQPIVDLTTGEVAGYESLVRIRRVDGTIAPPAHFIPIAEMSPIIADIDMVMLRHGLAALERLPEPLTVAVNLSTVTLTRPGYAQLIEQVIREAEVRTSRLHLEVTETALLGESTPVVTAMTSIAALGPRWYVDDFGTGYSSISHLRDLPVSGLKLDVSFSRGIREGEQTSIRLFQALAGLAGGLGLDTVAEGVETAEEAALLRAQGWRHGQGWLYGRPEPLA
jgi:diguanylate cyclase (GGDEF)-like protein/PAS domain S-box-containing protein